MPKRERANRKREGVESMKVTRLKKGYRINLSASEFDLLSGEMCSEFFAGECWYSEDWSHLPPSQQAILTQIANSKRIWLQVTEDRRE